MNSLPVQLKRTTAPQRATAAWLLRSDSPDEWLTVAGLISADQSTLRFLPWGDREAAGDLSAVLILSPLLANVALPSRCQAYGHGAERLLIPVDAVIDPALTAEEIADWMLDDQTIFVWHPTEGLVRFNANDVLTIFDLLAGPERSAADWNAARTVPAFAERLLSVASAEPLRPMVEVEAELIQEIGPTRSLANLPPIPGETPPRWHERLALTIASWYAKWQRWRQRFNSDDRVESQKHSNWLLVVLLAVFAICFLMLLMRTAPPQMHSPPQRNITGNAPSPGINLLPWMVLFGLGLGLLMVAARRALQGNARGTANTQPATTSPAPIRSSPGGFFQSWWGRFQQWWSGSRLARTWIERVNQSLRNREIARLLHMLAENPDDGLRYAIPLGGDAGRGRVVVGNELISHSLEFQLATGGGGPVDSWDVDPQQQVQLMQRYRELAEREQRLGRHRRATYVYSQLLGDWHSAANSLKQGRFFAEAAAIYLERLKNYGEAANCYELAGQYDAALKLHREQAQWLAAGDLCRRLDREDEALRDYRAAVQHAVSSHDLRTAATVLETKLQDVDGALDVLERSWPSSLNANQHFDHWFAIAARHARHDLSRRRIETLANDTNDDSATNLLLRLRNVYQQYPDAAIQHIAKESSLQIVARHLSTVELSRAKQLAQFLPGLSPQDRLLPRDCVRYLDLRRESERSTPRLPPQPNLNLRIMNRLSLGGTTLSLPILSCQRGLVVLDEPTGNSPQTLRLISRDLSMQQLLLGRGQENRRYALAAISDQRREIWMHPTGTESPMLWPHSADSWRVVFPSFLPRNWLVVRPLPSGITFVLWVDDGGLIWLTINAADGSICQSRRFAEEALVHPESAVQMLRGSAAIIPLDQDVFYAFVPLDDDHVYGECFEINGTCIWSGVVPGRQVIGPVAAGSAELLFCHQDRIVLSEDPRRSRSTGRTWGEWSLPKTGVLGGGLIAAADDRRVAVLNADDGRQIFESFHESSSPLGISLAGVGSFFILREEGEIELWGW